jgi:hypothetical protein
MECFLLRTCHRQTPMHPEDELRLLGATYQKIAGSSKLFGDIGATSTSCDSTGPIIFTGQNQNSACVTAQRQVEYLLGQAAIRKSPNP